VTVARCHDLRLCHAILRDSAWTPGAGDSCAAAAWDAAPSDTSPGAPALFDLEDGEVGGTGVPHNADAAVEEFRRQREALAAASDPARLELLLAAESRARSSRPRCMLPGCPGTVRFTKEFSRHPRHPPRREVAPRVRELGDVVRAALGDPAASLDSQPKLLRSLHRVGVLAESTSRWELARFDHPAIAPLLEYKKLTRLVSANGWAWLDEWAPAGRFRPVYVPGGVVTGRWASSGGEALQLPRQLRPRCVPTRDGPSSSPTSPSSSLACSPRCRGSCPRGGRADAISTTVSSSGASWKAVRGEDRDARSDVRRHDG
jgi:DNA polymerase-1